MVYANSKGQHQQQTSTSTYTRECSRRATGQMNTGETRQNVQGKRDRSTIRSNKKAQVIVQDSGILVSNTLSGVNANGDEYVLGSKGIKTISNPSSPRRPSSHSPTRHV